MNEQQDLDTIMAQAKPTTEPLDDAKELTRPEPRGSELVGGKVQLHDTSALMRMANMVYNSSSPISGAKSVHDTALALMAGLEAGLSATASQKNIMVVNGKATIWGDALLSLVLGSGQCLGCDVTIDGKGDDRVATCRIGRRFVPAAGEPSDVWIVRTFSVGDAKLAGLWGKGGPWKNYPERMLSARARTYAIRDLFADFIGGLSVREEVDDYRPFNPDRMNTRPSIAEVVEDDE